VASEWQIIASPLAELAFCSSPEILYITNPLAIRNELIFLGGLNPMKHHLKGPCHCFSRNRQRHHHVFNSWDTSNHPSGQRTLLQAGVQASSVDGTHLIDLNQKRRALTVNQALTATEFKGVARGMVVEVTEIATASGKASCPSPCIRL